jgi:hypothetical protein
MTGLVDEQLAQVVDLVAAAESAIQALDTDAAAGWGMLASARLEVVEFLEQLTLQPMPSGDALAPGGVGWKDPGVLYDAVAAAAAGRNPTKHRQGWLPVWCRH